MNKEDYFKYYIQGSDHYLLPKDVFIELFNEMSNWREEEKELNQKYLNAVADYETTMSELQELKKQLEEVEFIVGLRQKRNLIHKFDKEYDDEDKKKNPNRDYAGIMPDAEEVYRRYYSMKNQQKEFIEYLEDLIKQNETVVEVSKYGLPKNCSKLLIDFYKEILSKFKKIIGSDINVGSKGGKDE